MLLKSTLYVLFATDSTTIDATNGISPAYGEEKTNCLIVDPLVSLNLSTKPVFATEALNQPETVSLNTLIA